MTKWANEMLQYNDITLDLLLEEQQALNSKLQHEMFAKGLVSRCGLQHPGQGQQFIRQIWVLLAGISGVLARRRGVVGEIQWVNNRGGEGENDQLDGGKSYHRELFPAKVNQRAHKKQGAPNDDKAQGVHQKHEHLTLDA